MSTGASSRSGIRLADLVGALSLASGLGIGQPMGFALRAALVSVRLGEALRLTGQELSDAYYVALLRGVGCNAATWPPHQQEIPRDRRMSTFDEVELGLTKEDAVHEALRCIRCDLWRIHGVPSVWPRKHSGDSADSE